MAIEYPKCGQSKSRCSVRVKYTPGFNTRYMYVFSIPAIKNYYKFSSLKHPLIISVFCGPEVWFSCAPCLESQKAKIKVSVGLQSSLEALEHSGCGPNSVAMAVGQVLFPSWLWPRSSSQLQKATCIPGHIGPAIFKPATQHVESFSCLEFLWLLFLSHLFCW